MTNSTRILLAALVLSSGVCHSEAFSTASFLLSQQQKKNGGSFHLLQGNRQRTSSSCDYYNNNNNGAHTVAPPLKYAQNSNLDLGDHRPKRGRPRKMNNNGAASKKPLKSSTAGTTTTAAAAAAATTSRTRTRRLRTTTVVAAAASSTEGMTEDTYSKQQPKQKQQRRATTKSKKETNHKNTEMMEALQAEEDDDDDEDNNNNNNNKNSGSNGNGNSMFLRVDMLDHELLTKQDEQWLGLQVRRSIQLRETISAWMKEEVGEESSSSSSSSLDEQPESKWLAMYGTPTQQAMEQYFYQEDTDDDDDDDDEELLDQDGTPLEGDVQKFAQVYSAPQQQQQQQQRSSSSSSSSWIDEIFQGSSLDDQELNWLTDKDVQEGLNLPGGRRQLRQILLEGALARQKLIECNIRLVSSIAKRWAQNVDPADANIYKDYWNRPTRDELIQEGVLGLAEAAKRFDPDRGLRFTTYATFWITNYVRKKFQAESTSGLRLPMQYYEIKRKHILAVRSYLNKGEQPPPVEELAVDVGVSVKQLVSALQMTQPMVSLDAQRRRAQNSGSGKAGDGQDMETNYSLGGMLACEEPQPEDHVERSLLRQCLENAMATELSPSERDIVRMRLGLDDGVTRTAQEVAKECGGRLKVSEVRNMEKRAFKKLRSPFSVHSRNLMAYLDFAGVEGDPSLQYH